jgi:hypothetical protein
LGFEPEGSVQAARGSNDVRSGGGTSSLEVVGGAEVCEALPVCRYDIVDGERN